IKEECDYLISMAKPHMQKLRVVDSETGTKELEDAVFVRPKQQGKYIIVFDPLDGSSNIESETIKASAMAAKEKAVEEE
ncbi:hypothetical protein HN51_032661, partial [Arachis hypogaea]